MDPRAVGVDDADLGRAARTAEAQLVTERTFFAYDPNFLGGVRVAFGDVNGDGILDIITSGGPGGGPHITVRSGADLSYLASFFAYDPAFTGGVWVAAGDVNGDGPNGFEGARTDSNRFG